MESLIKAGDVFRIVKVKSGAYKIQRSNSSLGENWCFLGRVEENISYEDLTDAKKIAASLKEQERWLSDISEVVEIIEE